MWKYTRVMFDLNKGIIYCNISMTFILMSQNAYRKRRSSKYTTFYHILGKKILDISWRWYMEASEPKWVNSVLYINGVNSLKLEGLHIKPKI